MTDAHDENKTVHVEVEIPEHADRVTTHLFSESRREILKGNPVCWICGEPYSKESPLEAHHWIVERCLANMIDWTLLKEACLAGDHGEAPKNFDWDKFFEGAEEIKYDAFTDDRGVKWPAGSYLQPKNVYMFVDDMTVNGKLLCKKHHIGKDEGIHSMTYPLWLAQRYGKPGYKFSDVEVIHHYE